MVICKEPIITKRYEFLFSHLDCDCIADTTNEKKTKTISYVTATAKYHLPKQLPH